MPGNSTIPHSASQIADTATLPGRILIVDDCPKESSTSAFALRQDGHEVEETQYPLLACEIARLRPPDVVILDISMPELDGISLAHRLRDAGCDAELMFVTGVEELDMRVRGHEVGNYYLTKPFYPAELQAIVKALLRRRRYAPNGRPMSRELEHWMPKFDPNSDHVHVPYGRDNHLTRTERAVLRTLVEARGAIVSKEKFLRDIWHEEGPNDSLVHVYVSRVRGKIEINPQQPELVMTASGGYYYNVRS